MASSSTDRPTLAPAVPPVFAAIATVESVEVEVQVKKTQGWWCWQPKPCSPPSRSLTRLCEVSKAPGEQPRLQPSPEPTRHPVLSRETLRQLKERLRTAHSRAETESAMPVMHGGFCVTGLVLVQLLRLAAWRRGEYPPESVFALHALSMWADVSGIICTLPILVSGSDGPCVRYGCIGPVMTLVVAMALMDFIVMTSVFWLRPVVLHPPTEDEQLAESFRVVQSTLTSWNCAVIASTAFQVALCACFWRVYRTLRIAGLYPPNHEKLLQGDLPKEISPFELCCESEEVKLLEDCHNRECSACMTRPDEAQSSAPTLPGIDIEPQDLSIETFAPALHYEWHAENQRRAGVSQPYGIVVQTSTLPATAGCRDIPEWESSDPMRVM